MMKRLLISLGVWLVFAAALLVMMLDDATTWRFVGSIVVGIFGGLGCVHIATWFD